MPKSNERLELFVLICFVMSSFLTNLTVFPVKAAEESLIPKNELKISSFRLVLKVAMQYSIRRNR